MKLTKESRKLSKGLLRGSFTNGLLDAAKVKQVTDLVIQSKPRNYIGVLKGFARLIRLEAAKRHAVIESATALDDAQKNQITATIRAKYGADVTTDFKTNADLIGGLRIQVGSNVLDSSVRGRLDQLAIDLAA
jgi:F-type H+-transporting ATPase subunit delta